MKSNKWVKIASLALPPTSKKKIKCIPLENDINPAGLFYNNALEFYNIFRKNIGTGVYGDTMGETLPYLNSIGPCLTILHFSVELLLKSLIALKEKKFDKNKYGNHKIKDLFTAVGKYYPQVLELSKNNEYILLLTELQENFNAIRYGEVTIHLKPNARKGWKDKKPFEELIEDFDIIFSTLLQAFREESHRQDHS